MGPKYPIIPNLIVNLIWQHEERDQRKDIRPSGYKYSHFLLALSVLLPYIIKSGHKCGRLPFKGQRDGTHIRKQEGRCILHQQGDFYKAVNVTLRVDARYLQGPEASNRPDPCSTQAVLINWITYFTLTLHGHSS